MPGEEQKLAASLAEVVISDATNAATSKVTTEKIDKEPSGGDTAAAATAETASTKEDVVDPWNVTSNSETGIDYDKLIGKWSVFSLPKRAPL